jgi:O-antigen/teichoic acid export membrane protein
MIELFFEPAFAQAAIPLRWLSFALVILFIKHSFAVSLNAIGKQHLFSLFTGISMIINVGLNLILIPRFAMMGAALATVISEFITVILAVLALRKIVFYDKAKINLIKLSIVATLTWIFMYFMKFQALHFLITLIPSACLYILLIYLFRIISKNDLGEVTAMLKRKILPATIRADE